MYTTSQIRAKPFQPPQASAVAEAARQSAPSSEALARSLATLSGQPPEPGAPVTRHRRLQEQMARAAEAPDPEIRQQRGDLRKLLNRIKRLGPLVGAMALRPGYQAPLAEIDAAADALFAAHSDATRKVLDAVAPGEPNPALAAQVAAAITPYVSHAWVQGDPSAMAGVVQSVLAVMRHEGPGVDAAEPGFVPAREDLEERLGQARRAGELLPAIRRLEHLGVVRRFLVGDRDVETVLQDCMTGVESFAQDWAAQLQAGLPPMSEIDRRITLQSLRTRVVDLYAEALDSETRGLIRDLKTLSPAERRALLQDHPEGLLLDRVDQRVAQSGKLLLMAAQVAPAPRGVAP